MDRGVASWEGHLLIGRGEKEASWNMHSPAVHRGAGQGGTRRCAIPELSHARSGETGAHPGGQAGQ